MNKLKLSVTAFFLTGGLLTLWMSSCTSEYLENVNSVCFESEVLPIFQSNCTQSGCHNAIDREDGYDLTNYAGIVKKGIKAGDFSNSKMYQVLVRSVEVMPAKPFNRLSDAQIETIALWIQQGAENTTNCAPAGCDTTNVTFSGSVLPILNTYCNGCHAGSAPSADIDLSTWANTMPSVTNGSLLGSIEFSSSYSAMPKGGSQLSDCNISVIRKWIELGAQNN